MKLLLSALAFLSLSALAAEPPRPQLLLPTQEIQIPAELYPWDVAMAGDWMAVGGTVYGDPTVNLVTERVYLYQRDSNGAWGTGTLLLERLSDQYAATLEMNDQVLVVSTGVDTHIYEKSGGGWLERTMDASVASVSFLEIALDGTNVLLADGRCGATGTLLERTGAAHWAKTAELDGIRKTCDESQPPPLFVALSGNTAILWDTRASWDQHARVFERTSASTWVNTGFLRPPNNGLEYRFGTSLALRGSLALVGGWDRGGHIYRRSNSQWLPAGYLSTFEHAIQYNYRVRIGDRYTVFGNSNSTVDAGVLYVTRETADQGFQEVALLTTPERANVGSMFDLSGSAVVAATGQKVFFYQLPDSPGAPRPRQYDFESGSTTDWSIVPGGSFSVVQSGPTHVYRQSSTAGDAGAILAPDLDAQAIQADITPRAFNGTDRWFGLVTRYRDESNFYYVTVRNRDGGRVSLRRKLNGVVTELAAEIFDVPLNKPVRIRLVSTVDRHVVFIGDREFLSAVDNTLPQGRAGLRTYRAAADFDNVIVSAALPALYVSDTLTWAAEPFDPVDGVWAMALSPQLTGHYVQQSLTGDARSITWPVSDDQIVQSWIRVDTFATGGGDPWVGLIARYRDPQNYYYATMRRSNQISLRRVVNGQITILGSAALPVTPGVGRVLRLEAVGEQLRLYVDGIFVLESSDDTFASGKAGLVTYRAAASFLDFSAYRP